MEIIGNTILITGGGSGIGRGLAEAFYKEGNQVIIAGRRQNVLDDTVAANPGIRSLLLDIEDPANILAFGKQISEDYPSLNVVIHNAGIMRPESLQAQPEDLADANAIVTTNLLGPIRLTAALFPVLNRQPVATIMTVSSGLAFVPMAPTPTYCATKAAIHSYTQSLRYQLKDTSIEVLELIPPYVQTELLGAHQATDPRAMPLDAFIAEVMDILKSKPQPREICVKNVLALRNAESSGDYESFFKNFNDQMAANPHH